MLRTYLGSGQSNGRGKGTGGSFIIHPRTTVWNNMNERTDLAYLGDMYVVPERDEDPFVNSYNNMFVHAASEIARITGDDVRLIIVAKGAIDIGYWYADSQRQCMLNRTMAVLQAAGVTSLDGFWWHQGESDNGTTEGRYVGRWNAIKNALTVDGYMNSSTPIVMGEATPTHPGTNSNLLACLDSRTLLAPIKTFEDIGDGTHYTGDSLVRAGLVYAGLQMLLEGGS